MSHYEYDEDYEKFKSDLNKSAQRGAALKAVVFGLFSIVAIGFIGWSLATATPTPEDGLGTAYKAGFTETRIIESGFITLRCSESDRYYYRISGKNPRGDQTTFTVCCGIFKDCTVRY